MHWKEGLGELELRTERELGHRFLLCADWRIRVVAVLEVTGLNFLMPEVRISAWELCARWIRLHVTSAKTQQLPPIGRSIYWLAQAKHLSR